jgi:hypothetical protein
MKWLEIIELRTGNQNKQELEKFLERLCSELKGDSNHPEFRIYENCDIDSDLSIHIFHSTQIPDLNQSALSYHITSMLRSFGLVRRTTWMERKANKRKDHISNENE